MLSQLPRLTKGVSCTYKLNPRKFVEVKFTKYFQEMRLRSDRAAIRLEWIQQVLKNPVREIIQKDGRIRRFGPLLRRWKVGICA
jgi:hypothetical protein